ncbi:hypothetical protein TNCV_1121491 [Trichonephila clavipes]|uniref:Uncharacterized protein n=1 Tax=Trichonephila clavipes TaxID=2585209 RepID=A0A8X6VT36_TRICX|nr:hypothetical protein TNCV_1121491 [Trichonephila clavipes]
MAQEPFPYQQLEAIQAVFPPEITFEQAEVSLYYHISASGLPFRPVSRCILLQSRPCKSVTEPLKLDPLSVYIVFGLPPTSYEPTQREPKTFSGQGGM